MKLNSKLSILIVEDEIILSHTMREMLFDFGLKNVFISNSYNEALSFISSENYDIVILDINLENGNEGLELAKICLIKGISFFYVTSYTDKKTLDLALETSPGAYVIKPIISINLYSAINLTLKNGKKSEKAQFLNFKDGRETLNMNVNDITFLRSDGVYVEINSLTGRNLARGSLQGFMKDLPRSFFYQTHRSYIVNSNHIERINNQHITIQNEIIPISRSFRAELRKLFS